MTVKGQKSNYRIGRAFELEIKEMFEKAGWDVTLATMSQGKYDVVAFSPMVHTPFDSNPKWEKKSSKEYICVYSSNTPTQYKKVYADWFVGPGLTTSCMAMQCKTRKRILKKKEGE